VIEPAKLAELREALEEQRENLRKEIVEQGATRIRTTRRSTSNGGSPIARTRRQNAPGCSR